MKIMTNNSKRELSKTMQWLKTEETSVDCLALKEQQRSTLGNFYHKTSEWFPQKTNLFLRSNQNQNSEHITFHQSCSCLHAADWETYPSFFFLSLSVFSHTNLPTAIVDSNGRTKIRCSIQASRGNGCRKSAKRRWSQTSFASDKKYNPCPSSWRVMAKQRLLLENLRLNTFNVRLLAERRERPCPLRQVTDRSINIRGEAWVCLSGSYDQRH